MVLSECIPLTIVPLSTCFTVSLCNFLMGKLQVKPCKLCQMGVQSNIKIANLCFFEDEFGMPAGQHFFATSHGKSEGLSWRNTKKTCHQSRNSFMSLQCRRLRGYMHHLRSIVKKPKLWSGDLAGHKTSLYKTCVN